MFKTHAHDAEDKKHDAYKGHPGVRYDFRTHSFLVAYMGDDDRLHQKTKGFTVPREDFTGAFLTAAQMSQAKNKMRQKACAKWDKLDRAGRARYGV